jgi:hypothetical protein
MADGRNKPIDQIKVGDQIADAAPGALLGTSDQIHTDHDYTDVTIKTTHGPATITGTANHPYWDTTTHTWTQCRVA